MHSASAALANLMVLGHHAAVDGGSSSPCSSWNFARTSAYLLISKS